MLYALRKQPWYLLLLPLFFVLHGFAENFGFINFGDVLILALTYVAAAFVIFSLFFIFFRNRVKAALASSFLMSFYLFFGAVQDFFKIYLNAFNKYSVLLPLFIILLVVLIVYLKKTRSSFSKLNLFLNFLLIIYIVVDLGSLIFKYSNPPVNKLSAYSFEKNNHFLKCEECSKPDIYFLLFDEYASTASLKNHFNFDNNSFDTFLIQHGFHIQQKSRSNYNFTPLSMASMLNMSYLEGITPNDISIEDYARCNKLIRNNAVINFLSSQGYEIVNYSIFDLAGNPSLISQNILPLKTKLITDGTLLSRMQKDIGWMLVTGKYEIKWLSDKLFFENMHNNETFLRLLKESSATRSNKPRLFYGHLFMPHPPFYFDKNGNLKNSGDIYKESGEINTAAYLEYVTYTNTKIKDLVSAIMTNTDRKAVIIFMGDHGFRKETKDQDKAHYFEIQNAVYFPGGDYHLLYDSISAVNQFPVIFNTLFRQNFPILKDSTIFLTDKK